MGNTIVRAFERLVSCSATQDLRILMVGLDGAGKTTILYRLKLGEHVRTVPTVGFNVETVRMKNFSFTVWDVGGQDRIRHLWKQYMANAQGLIFVIDSSDKEKERMRMVKQELFSLVSDPDMNNLKLLILCNKHDLPSAMSVSEAAQRLGLHKLEQQLHIKWHIHHCSAKTGEGLHDAFQWLANTIREPSILQRVASLRLSRSSSNRSLVTP